VTQMCPLKLKTIVSTKFEADPTVRLILNDGHEFLSTLTNFGHAIFVSDLKL